LSGKRVEPRGTLQIEVRPVGRGGVCPPRRGEAKVGLRQAVVSVRPGLFGAGWLSSRGLSARQRPPFGAMAWSTRRKASAKREGLPSAKGLLVWSLPGLQKVVAKSGSLG